MSSGHVDEFPHQIKGNDEATPRRTLLGRFKAALEAMRVVLDEIEERPLPEPGAAEADLFVALWALASAGDLEALRGIIAEIEHAIEEIAL